MKASYILLCILGFVAGAATAWLIPLHQPATGNEPAALSASSGSQEKSSGQESLTSLWKALQCGKLTGLSRSLALADLVAKVTSSEIPGLLKLTEHDPALRELLLRRWVALDPVMVADWLAPRMDGSNTAPDDHSDDIFIAFSAWAERDPVAAIAKIRANAGVVPGVGYNVQVMARLLKQDMAAGIKFGALTESSRTLAGIYWNTGGSGWVQQDPAKAAALLSALPAGEFKDVSLRRAIAELSIKNLEGAIALQQKYPDLAGLPGGQSANSGQGFYAQWAQKDLAGMTAFVNEKAGGETRQDMKAAIAKSLGESDPERGLTWAAENLSGDRRHEAVKEILTNLARKNPEGALRYLDSMPEGSALDKAVETFSDTIPPGDFADLLSKANSLPEGAARQSLTAKAYEKWYQKEPEALLQKLAQQDAASLPPGIWGSLGKQTNSIAEGVKRLENVPPASSVDFVKSLCQKNFDMNDPLDKMTASVDQFQNQEHRAAAIEVLAGQYWWRANASLVAWATTLPSASERKIVADQILQSKGNLTPLEREKLVAPLR